MKLVRESLNERLYRKSKFYPNGYDAFFPVYSDVIDNVSVEDREKFIELEESGKIKARMAPTNDYLIFYKSDDKETEEFLSKFKVEENN